MEGEGQRVASKPTVRTMCITDKSPHKGYSAPVQSRRPFTKLDKIGMRNNAIVPRAYIESGFLRKCQSIGKLKHTTTASDCRNLLQNPWPRPARPAYCSKLACDAGKPQCRVRSTPPTSTPSSEADTQTTAGSLLLTSSSSICCRSVRLYPRR